MYTPLGMATKANGSGWQESLDKTNDRLSKTGLHELQLTHGLTKSHSVQSTAQTSQWEWNDRGIELHSMQNLLTMLKHNTLQSVTRKEPQSQPDHTATTPTYFKEAYVAGLNTGPHAYGGLVPLVAIYEIDWDAYNATITP